MVTELHVQRIISGLNWSWGKYGSEKWGWTVCFLAEKVPLKDLLSNEQFYGVINWYLVILIPEYVIR